MTASGAATTASPAATNPGPVAGARIPSKPRVTRLSLGERRIAGGYPVRLGMRRQAGARPASAQPAHRQPRRRVQGDSPERVFFFCMAFPFVLLARTRRGAVPPGADARP